MIFVFPGQGSQYVGMGKSLYDNFSVAKDVFDEVDSALGQNLSKIIFSGPCDDLSLTENTQPALMAVSIAALCVLLQESGNKKIQNVAKYLAGHSLGEYSAFCASGAASIADIAKLLKIRGKAMQEAVPKGQGAMLALLKTNYNEVAELIKNFGSCEISNDNSSDQVVVSGKTDDIERFAEYAKDNGIKKVIKLNVSAPFHSQFMKSAADGVQNALQKVEFCEMKVPIISNVTAGPVTCSQEIKKLLVDQVTKCVRWRESILYCEQNNINKFIEVGAGNILTKLISRIHKNSLTCNLENTADLDNAIKFITDGN